MLKAFRNNDIIVQIIVILAVAGLMWAKSFAYPLSTPPSGGGILFYWLTGAMSPTLATVLGFVLMLAEGVLLTSILYRHKLIGQGTLLPVLFFVIAMSIGRPSLTPVMLGTLFLLVGIDQLLITSTLLSIGLDKTFGAAACVGLSIVLCPTMVVFVIPVIISMFNFSLYSWRDWAMFILGLLAPWIIVETYYWLCDEMFYRNYLLWYTVTDIHLSAWGNVLQWIWSILFLLLLVCGLFKVIGSSRNHNINFNKNITTLLLFTIGSVGLTLYTQLFPVPAEAYAIPFACCTTYLFANGSSTGSFSSRRNDIWINVAFVVTVVFFAAINMITPIA